MRRMEELFRNSKGLRDVPPSEMAINAAAAGAAVKTLTLGLVPAAAVGFECWAEAFQPAGEAACAGEYPRHRAVRHRRRPGLEGPERSHRDRPVRASNPACPDADWRGSGSSVHADLAKITVPTLILVGDRDHFCSVEEATVALRSLGHGQLAVIPDLGHVISTGKIEALVSFLAS